MRKRDVVQERMYRRRRDGSSIGEPDGPEDWRIKILQPVAVTILLAIVCAIASGAIMWLTGGGQ